MESQQKLLLRLAEKYKDKDLITYGSSGSEISSHSKKAEDMTAEQQEEQELMASYRRSEMLRAAATRVGLPFKIGMTEENDLFVKFENSLEKTLLESKSMWEREQGRMLLQKLDPNIRNGSRNEMIYVAVKYEEKPPLVECKAHAVWVKIGEEASLQQQQEVKINAASASTVAVPPETEEEERVFFALWPEQLEDNRSRMKLKSAKAKPPSISELPSPPTYSQIKFQPTKNVNSTNNFAETLHPSQSQSQQQAKWPEKVPFIHKKKPSEENRTESKVTEQLSQPLAPPPVGKAPPSWQSHSGAAARTSPPKKEYSDISSFPRATPNLNPFQQGFIPPPVQPGYKKGYYDLTRLAPFITNRNPSRNQAFPNTQGNPRFVGGGGGPRFMGMGGGNDPRFYGEVGPRFLGGGGPRYMGVRGPSYFPPRPQPPSSSSSRYGPPACELRGFNPRPQPRPPP